MQLTDFETAKAYVGFDDASAARLQALHGAARSRLGRVVDDFYGTILSHPHARALLSGGTEQVARLQTTLLAWLERGLLGPHDAAFLAARQRIGRAHVAIGMPQELMFTAMNRIRRGLHECARDCLAADQLEPARTAVDQWLDLELALMLDSYQGHWVERIRSSERLATIGQFAASIGHELRSPLGIVQSSAFLIGERCKQLQLDDPILNQHQQRIGEQVRHCSVTLASLLDLAREGPPQRVQQSLLQAVRRTLESKAIPKGVALQLAIEDDLQVYADPTQLARIVSNLLDNALQALGDHGTIVLSAEAHDGGFELFVEDDGPGIEQALRERVFDLWFTTKKQGTGVGLALSRKIAEAHGGTLTVTNKARGASLRLWLPGPP